MKKLSLLLTVLFMILMSCQKDDDISNTQQEPPQVSNHDAAAFAQNFGNSISRTFLGNVVDTNNNPIVDVLITIGNTSAMTDINGVFIIQDATVNERFGYITAEKAGFIHASRAVVPSEGTNNVTIMMLPETNEGFTSSGIQETINLANGASVSLEGDYIKEDGTTYEGNVRVISHFLDPLSEAIGQQMPGMLYGANAQNEEVSLQNYGIVAIELKAQNGEDLNIALDSSAEIRIPLDASLLADAPSTIPLWYFDEVNGYWIEEGQATLTENEYVGTVTHFSFWGCNTPTNAVTLCLNIINEEGVGISDQFITLSDTNTGFSQGRTNTEGIICQLIPMNSDLNLQLRGPGCNPYFFYESIGSFNEDSEITITIPVNPQIIPETITGVFNECQGNPITYGYVHLSYAGHHYFSYVNDGDFEFNIMRCEDITDFSIRTFDLTNGLEGFTTNYSFVTPNTDVGTLTTCSFAEEFIELSIDDGDIYFYMDSSGSLSAYLSENNDGEAFLEIIGECYYEICFVMYGRLYDYPYIGQYGYLQNNDGSVPMFYLNLSFEYEIFQISQENNNITFNLTSIGEVGEYVDLNFSGSFQEIDGTPHTINCIVRVLRFS